MLRHEIAGEGVGAFGGLAPRAGVRDGRNPVERKAVARVRREIAAMPASLVVQLAVWPDEIAAWARAEATSESLVYNMLARRKPYLRVRERLAERLEVSPAIVSHLVDGRRPLPSAKRDPALAGEGDEGRGAVDWSRGPYPTSRDGTSPIERRAVRVVEREIASMPASAVVGLALWPTTLAEWSREHRLTSSLVWATLAGSPSERVRAALALRLDVTRRDLDDLIAASRAQPGATRTPPLLADRAEAAQESRGPTTVDPNGVARAALHIVDESPPPSDTSPEPPEQSEPPERDQLTLGF